MKIRELNDLYETTNIRKGVIRTENASEELDSMTMVLTQVGSLAIEPYDVIEFTNEVNKKEYWCVASYERSIVTRGSTNLYDYTLNLMDLTKLLETIILPNMSITNIGQNNSIAYYIEHTFLQYFHNDYNKNAVVMTSLKTLFSDVAPEYTFSEPTLREYLDFLMECKGCISKLFYNGSYFVLYCKDLNPSSGTFPIENCNTLVQSQSANDYVTELVSNMGQILATEPKTEFHGLRSKDYVFDSNTATLILDEKIGELSNVEVVDMGGTTTQFYIENGNIYYLNNGVYKLPNPDASDGNLIDFSIISGKTSVGGSCIYQDGLDRYNLTVWPGPIDITDNVVEESVYNSLEMLGAGDYLDHIATNTKYKNNCIYFAPGGSTIDGINTFQSKQQFIGMLTDLTAVEHACLNRGIMNNIVSVAGKTYIDSTGATQTFGSDMYQLCQGVSCNGYVLYAIIKISDGWSTETEMLQNEGYSYRNVKFRVTYKPYIDMKIKQRQDDFRHLVSQANNSTNAKTDLIYFYKQEVEKNNQLGNAALSFYGDVPIWGTKFQVGQTYVLDGDTYYVNKLEYTRKNNLMTFKGTLTKNYSNRNINAILNREKRYYSLPQESESVSRNEVIISNYSDWNNEVKILGVTHYEKELLDSYHDSLVAAVYGYGRGDSVTFLGSVPCTTLKVADDTYIINIVFYDNVALGFRVSDKTIGASLPLSEYIPYTDEQGECFYLKITLFSRAKYTLDSSNLYDYKLKPTTLLDITKSFEFGNSTESLSHWRKDAREKTGITIIVKK